MIVDRNHILAAAALVALVAASSAIRSAEQDVAVLRTFGVTGFDSYTTLWVLDDGYYVWIRAHRPDRIWLDHLRRNPAVELKRNGTSSKFRATVFPRPDARNYVDAGFSEKYGLADRWRTWQNGTNTVPVRLEPR